MANTTRSSLELMLDKIQQLDNDHQPNVIVPPALPFRPVSRARLPRVRRPLPVGVVVESKITTKEDISNGVIKRTEALENSKEEAEKGISIIQKWYRGYQARCHYEDLRRGAISLQSFVRGENTRRDYQHRTKRFTTMNDCVQVPYSVLVDLQKRVFITDAKVREKKEENVVLKAQLKTIDTKWQQYEERMKSMEKKWQDELTYIQKCLVASKKNQAPDIRFVQFDSRQRHSQNHDTNCIVLTGNTNISSQVDECGLVHYEDRNLSEAGLEQVCNKLNPYEELRKLKLRFKVWKNDYKYKLKEAQLSFKKPGNSKIQKHWWAR